jgi:hypothetical protein
MIVYVAKRQVDDDIDLPSALPLPSLRASWSLFGCVSAIRVDRNTAETFPRGGRRSEWHVIEVIEGGGGVPS